MQTDQRKAAIAAYRQRKTSGGIYAVVCRPSNQRWIGRTADLDKIQNRLWFTLRQGSCRQPGLQAAWTAHGPDAFILDILERLEDEAIAFVRDRILTERMAHWRAVHGAEAI